MSLRRDSAEVVVVVVLTSALVAAAACMSTKAAAVLMASRPAAHAVQTDGLTLDFMGGSDSTMWMSLLLGEMWNTWNNFNGILTVTFVYFHFARRAEDPIPVRKLVTFALRWSLTVGGMEAVARALERFASWYLLSVDLEAAFPAAATFAAPFGGLAGMLRAATGIRVLANTFRGLALFVLWPFYRRQYIAIRGGGMLWIAAVLVMFVFSTLIAGFVSGGSVGMDIIPPILAGLGVVVVAIRNRKGPRAGPSEFGSALMLAFCISGLAHFVTDSMSTILRLAGPVTRVPLWYATCLLLKQVFRMLAYASVAEDNPAFVAPMQFVEEYIGVLLFATLGVDTPEFWVAAVLGCTWELFRSTSLSHCKDAIRSAITATATSVGGGWLCTISCKLNMFDGFTSFLRRRRQPVACADSVVHAWNEEEMEVEIAAVRQKHDARLTEEARYVRDSTHVACEALALMAALSLLSTELLIVDVFQVGSPVVSVAVASSPAGRRAALISVAVLTLLEAAETCLALAINARSLERAYEAESHARTRLNSSSIYGDLSDSFLDRCEGGTLIRVMPSITPTPDGLVWGPADRDDVSSASAAQSFSGARRIRRNASIGSLGSGMSNRSFSFGSAGAVSESGAALTEALFRSYVIHFKTFFIVCPCAMVSWSVYFMTANLAGT